MRRWLTTASLVWGCGFCAEPVVSATADLEAVGRVLGEFGSVDPNPGASAGLVDAIAKLTTTKLGRGNPDWKPTNPRWPEVYALVRADLEAEAPQLTADLAAASKRASARLASAVAPNVSQSDVEAVLTYCGTEQGQRFVALMSRLDSLFARGYSPPPGVDPKALAVPLHEDEQHRLLELLSLSRTIQAAMGAQQVGAALHADTSGLSGVVLLMGLIMQSHHVEVAALYTQYAPDIPAFGEFEKTSAAQSLFQALGRAVFLSKDPPASPISEVLAGVEVRHQKAWLELYKQNAP